MLGLSALNHSSPGAQARLSQYQAQLQQARREATQARDRVAQLERQAETARQDEARADDKVRSLENQPPRTDDSRNAGNRPRINTLSQLSGTLLNTVA